jgi:hypothetical protein
MEVGLLKIYLFENEYSVSLQSSSTFNILITKRNKTKSITSAVWLRVIPRTVNLVKFDIPI